MDKAQVEINKTTEPNNRTQQQLQTNKIRTNGRGNAAIHSWSCESKNKKSDPLFLGSENYAIYYLSSLQNGVRRQHRHYKPAQRYETLSYEHIVCHRHYLTSISIPSALTVRSRLVGPPDNRTSPESSQKAKNWARPSATGINPSKPGTRRNGLSRHIIFKYLAALFRFCIRPSKTSLTAKTKSNTSLSQQIAET